MFRYANSFLNPLIYAFVNKDFKMAFRALLCCRNMKHLQHRLERHRESIVNGPMTRAQYMSARRNSYLSRPRQSDPERPNTLGVRSQNTRRSLQMIVPPAIPLQRVSLSFSGPSGNGYIGVGCNGVGCNSHDSPPTPDGRSHSPPAPTVSTIAEERSEDLTDTNGASPVPRLVVHSADSPENERPTFSIQTPDSPSPTTPPESEAF